MIHSISLILQGIGIALLAPLLMGWLRQLTAWLQNRQAMSLWQPYYQLSKLWLKTPVVADNASWLFRATPYLYFTCLLVLCFVVPFIWVQGIATPWVDVIVLAGLLAMARIFLLLAAMDIGTAFGSLGARREVFVSCLCEPVLLLVFLNSALLAHNAYLAPTSVHWMQHPILAPSLFFSLLAYLMILLAETGRVPIDNPSSHLELTMLHEAMILEYSGRHLALIEWGSALKLMLYLLLLIALFCPYGLSHDWSVIGILIGAASSIVKLALLSIMLAGIAALNAKMRLFRIPEYLASSFMLAVLGLLLTQLTGATL